MKVLKQVIAIVAILLFSSFAAHSQSWVRDARQTPDSRLGSLTPMPYKMNNNPKIRTRELSIFPNPACAATKISVSNMTDQAVGKGYTMQVHATDGRLVHQQGWSAGQGLDVSGFAEGTYLVTVRRGDLLFTQKLFVKKQ